MLRNKIIMLIAFLYKSFFISIITVLLFAFVDKLILKKKRRKLKYIINAVFWMYLMLVLHITGLFEIRQISMERFISQVQDMWSLEWGGNAEITMIILNLIMFFPLGFLLPIATDKEIKSKTIIILALVFSSIIEVIQGFSGRFMELNDIIANICGAEIGYIIYKLLFSLANRIGNNRSGKPDSP